MVVTVNERVALLVKSLADGDQKRFAQEIGISPSTLNTIVKTRKTNPSYEVIYKIASRYENVNMSWLIRGDGSMFMESSSTTEPIAVKGKESDDAFWKDQMRVKDQIILDQAERLKRCETLLAEKNHPPVSYDPELGNQKTKK